MPRTIPEDVLVAAIKEWQENGRKVQPAAKKAGISRYTLKCKLREYGYLDAKMRRIKVKRPNLLSLIFLTETAISQVNKRAMEYLSSVNLEDEKDRDLFAKNAAGIIKSISNLHESLIKSTLALREDEKKGGEKDATQLKGTGKTSLEHEEKATKSIETAVDRILERSKEVQRDNAPRPQPFSTPQTNGVSQKPSESSGKDLGKPDGEERQHLH